MIWFNFCFIKLYKHYYVWIYIFYKQLGGKLTKIWELISKNLLGYNEDDNFSPEKNYTIWIILHALFVKIFKTKTC